MGPRSVGLIISIMWCLFALVLSLCGMWMRQRRRAAELDLLKTYALQNKEPPPELLALLRAGNCGGRNSSWRQVTIYGSLAVGFAVSYYVMNYWIGSPHKVDGLLIPAIIFGSFSLGQLIYALAAPRFDTQ